MPSDRLFIALALPHEVRNELSRIQATLQSPQFAVRWVQTKNMHLTLAFLGDTERSMQPSLCAHLQQSLAECQQLTLQLAPLGCFPNYQRPSVVWAGVHDREQQLTALHRTIHHTLRTLELPFDTKPFRPHLTLGRTQRSATPTQQLQIGQTIQQYPSPQALVWQVDQVLLYRSVLQTSGPVYRVLDQWTLQKPQ